MVLQGIIQQSIKTILLNESEWFAHIARNRKHSQEAFMVHVLVFILTWIIPSFILGNMVLCRWLSDKESAFQCRRRRRHGFDPWIRKIPWRRKWQPTPVLLPGKSWKMDREAWRATIHRVAKSQTQLSPWAWARVLSKFRSLFFFVAFFVMAHVLLAHGATFMVQPKSTHADNYIFLTMHFFSVVG